MEAVDILREGVGVALKIGAPMPSRRISTASMS